jgi:hypothetical protein
MGISDMQALRSILGGAGRTLQAEDRPKGSADDFDREAGVQEDVPILDLPLTAAQDDGGSVMAKLAEVASLLAMAAVKDTKPPTLETALDAASGATSITTGSAIPGSGGRSTIPRPSTPWSRI